MAPGLNATSTYTISTYTISTYTISTYAMSTYTTSTYSSVLRTDLKSESQYITRFAQSEPKSCGLLRQLLTNKKIQNNTQQKIRLNFAENAFVNYIDVLLFIAKGFYRVRIPKSECIAKSLRIVAESLRGESEALSQIHLTVENSDVAMQITNSNKGADTAITSYLATSEGARILILSEKETPDSFNLFGDEESISLFVFIKRDPQMLKAYYSDELVVY